MTVKETIGPVALSSLLYLTVTVGSYYLQTQEIQALSQSVSLTTLMGMVLFISFLILKKTGSIIKKFSTVPLKSLRQKVYVGVACGVALIAGIFIFSVNIVGIQSDFVNILLGFFFIGFAVSVLYNNSDRLPFGTLVKALIIGYFINKAIVDMFRYDLLDYFSFYHLLVFITEMLIESVVIILSILGAICGNYIITAIETGADSDKHILKAMP